MLFLVCYEHHIPENFEFAKLKISDDTQFTTDLMSYRNALMFMRNLVTEKHRYAYLCKTSMLRISEEYPFLCKYHNSVPITLKDISKYPSEIFEDCLYLGNASTCKDEGIIQTLGITHILNISDNIPNYFEDDDHFKLKYENIYIEDVEDAPIMTAFKQAYEFIDQALFTPDVDSDLTKHEPTPSENTQD